MSNSSHTSLALAIRCAMVESGLFRTAVLSQCGVFGPSEPLLQEFPSTWKNLGSVEGQATDIFVRFRCADDKVVGLHGKLVRRISNLTEVAAIAYKDRAEAMSDQLEYDKWVCTLFAPREWIEQSPDFAKHLNAAVSLEEMDALQGLMLSVTENF